MEVDISNLPSVLIKGTVKWFSDEPNDSGKYELSISELSEDAQAALAEVGIKVKSKEGTDIKFISISNTKPIKLKLPVNEKLGEGEKVGAGSKIVAEVIAFPWKYQKKSGISPKIRSAEITELVTYTPGSGSSIDPDEAL